MGEARTVQAICAWDWTGPSNKRPE